MMNSQQTLATTTDTVGESPMAFWLGTAPTGRVQLGHSFSATSERLMGSHEHLFIDGDTQTHIYQILEGVVGVYKLLADGRRQIVTFCYPGDMIGLDHLEHFSHHAEALGTARVRCIPQNAVDSLIRSEPGFGQALLRLLSTELADTRDQLLSLGRKSALEKVATFLLRISKRNERHGRDKNTLHLPMTRCDIADYLGLTIETVSRNFTKLKVTRVIHLSNNSEVEILDQDQLEQIAEGGTSEH